MAEKVLLTKEGFQQLKDELEHLKTVERKEVVEKIKEAREQGDLSENAEYDSAKNQQAILEAKIAELEEKLLNVQIIAGKPSKSSINVGSHVKLHDETYNEDVEYVIVGTTEAKISQGKISNESPVGAALIGRKAGDTVSVSTPGGTVKYTIISFK